MKIIKIRVSTVKIYLAFTSLSIFSITMLYIFAYPYLVLIIKFIFLYIKELMLAVMTATNIYFRVELELAKKDMTQRATELKAMADLLKSESDANHNNNKAKIVSIQRDLNQLDKIVRKTREEHIGVRESLLTIINIFKTKKNDTHL